MKVLVCGGRDFNDEDFLYATLDAVRKKHGEKLAIIHGAARGADLLAEDWAKDREVPYIGVPAKWKKFGKGAGYERNSRMLKMTDPDAVIAFKGGTGTSMMCELAEKAGLPVWKP